MDWKSDISSSTKEWMKFLGDFSPTVYTQTRELKGRIRDDKVYLDSGELRELAKACNEVAEWLDKRAEAAPNDI